MINDESSAKLKQLIALRNQSKNTLEIPIGSITPILLYKHLSQAKRGDMLIEVSEDSRYAYVGIDPDFIFIGESERSTIYAKNQSLHINASFFEVLKFLSIQMAGFIAHEAINAIEVLPKPVGEKQVPDCHLAAHRLSFLFDYQKEIITITTFGVDLSELAQICNTLENLSADSFCAMYLCNGTSQAEIKSEAIDPAFMEKVEEAKKYIKEGDIFQIVLSRTFSGPCEASPSEIYCHLKNTSPTPFMFLLDMPEYAIVGSSPERLAKIKDRHAKTMPIAGTRPRNQSLNDKKLEEELLNDPKELAEHMMLVDLGRNDIGAVSIPGSVKVEEFKAIHRYSHVMHIVSVVSGKLRDDKDAIDAFKAIFPAGTLTGAPKIRAMELIHQFENRRRGIYGGAIVFFDGLGNLDSFITIRTAFIKNGLAEVAAGAGIVHDSVPERESAECFHKAQGILKAIGAAKQGRKYDSADR